MTAVTERSAATWSIRPADDRDNAALCALARACPMVGEVTVCVHREPRFLALDALLGDPWQVLIAEADGLLVGTVAWAVRDAFVNGHRRPTGYVGDLKVHPAVRRSGVGAALALAVRDELRRIDPDLPVLLTALRGNVPVSRLAHVGGRGRLAVPYAAVRVHAIPLLARRQVPSVPGFAVLEAGPSDIDGLVDFWASIGPDRQFRACQDPEGLAAAPDGAPGLDRSSYLVARGADGRIVACAAIWDQHRLKTTRILRYGGALRWLRSGFNLVAPMLGAPRLPGPGGALRVLQAFNVGATSAAALRAVVVEALHRYAGRGYALLMMGLDRTDPLTAALAGLWAQPTEVDAFVAVPGRLGGCRSLDGRPLHYETALV